MCPRNCNCNSLFDQSFNAQIPPPSRESNGSAILLPLFLAATPFLISRGRRASSNNSHCPSQLLRFLANYFGRLARARALEGGREGDERIDRCFIRGPNLGDNNNYTRALSLSLSFSRLDRTFFLFFFFLFSSFSFRSSF